MKQAGAVHPVRRADNKLYAVLTLPFTLPKDFDYPRLLSMIVDLLISAGVERDRIIVVHDVATTGGRETAESVVAPEQVLSVASTDTAFRWLDGIRSAIEKGADSVLVFPGDARLDILGGIKRALGNHRRGRPLSHKHALALEEGCRRLRLALENAVQGSDPKGLFLLDYVCDEDSTRPGYEASNTFKAKFDEYVLIPLVVTLWPMIFHDLLNMGIHKHRTELFVLGREYFSAFMEEKAFTWSADPTVSLILWSLLRARCHDPNEFPVHVEFFGRFVDDDTRKWVPELLQVTRLAGALESDRIRYDHDAWRDSRALKPNKQQKHYRAIASCLHRNFRLLDDILADVYRWHGGFLPWTVDSTRGRIAKRLEELRLASAQSNP